MKQLVIGTMCSMTLAAVVSAQSGATTQATRPDAQSKAQPMTVTGCLQSGPGGVAGSTGTSGAAGAASSASRAASGFVLTDISTSPATDTDKKPDLSETPAPTSGTAAASSHGYRLTGDTSALNSHVNHRVEIIGTIETAATANPSAGAAGNDPMSNNAGANSPTSGASGMGKQSDMPRLRVSSVKEVAGTCSPQ